MSEILALFNQPDDLYRFSNFSSRYGHVVIAGRNVQRAKTIIEERRPHVVVAPIDYEYGEVLSLLRWVKSEPGLKGIQFLFFVETDRQGSAANLDSLKQVAKLLGADKFVALPHFHAAELWWQVAVVLPD